MIVDGVPRATDGGEAATSDLDALTEPTVTVTAALSSMDVLSMLAEMVCEPSPVEEKVVVKTPAPLVEPDA